MAKTISIYSSAFLPLSFVYVCGASGQFPPAEPRPFCLLFISRIHCNEIFPQYRNVLHAVALSAGALCALSFDASSCRESGICRDPFPRGAGPHEQFSVSARCWKRRLLPGKNRAVHNRKESQGKYAEQLCF